MSEVVFVTWSVASTGRGGAIGGVAAAGAAPYTTVHPATGVIKQVLEPVCLEPAICRPCRAGASWGDQLIEAIVASTLAMATRTGIDVDNRGNNQAT